MGTLNSSGSIAVKSDNPIIDKFVHDQVDQLLKSAKLHELVERISYSEEISKEKALKVILEKFINQTSRITIAKKTAISLVRC